MRETNQALLTQAQRANFRAEVCRPRYGESMRVRTTLLLVAALSSGIAAACGSFSGNDTAGGADATSDAGELDGTASAPAAADGASTDGGASFDAGPTCDAGFCKCKAPMATFCDDFDRPGETAGAQGWTDSYRSDGGVLRLDAPASSPPFALHAFAPKVSGATDTPTAAVAISIGSIASVTTQAAFDLFIPDSVKNCTGSSLDTRPYFVEIASEPTPWRPTESLFVGLVDSVTVLQLIQSPAPVVQDAGAGAGLAFGHWQRVVLTLSFGADAGVSIANATLALTTSGSADAAAPALLTLSTPTTTFASGTHWLVIGRLDIQGAVAAASADCGVYIDNVVLEQH